VRTASGLRQRLAISDVPHPARRASAAVMRNVPAEREVLMRLLQSECGHKVEAQSVLDGNKEK
jgi:hypothetical protein